MGKKSPLDRIDQVLQMSAFANLNGGQTRVLLYLVKKDQGKGAWPSVPRIMAKAGLSRMSVYRALRELKDRGLIEAIGKHGKPGKETVHYRVLYTGKGYRV